MVRMGPPRRQRAPRWAWACWGAACSIGITLSLGGCARTQDVPLLLDALPVGASFGIRSEEVAEIYGVAVLPDSTVIFSDIGTRSLFWYNPFTDELHRLGRQGKGPGEYLVPGEITYWNGKVFFKEFAGPVVKIIDLDGIAQSQIGPEIGFILSFAVSRKGTLYLICRDRSAARHVLPSGAVLASSVEGVPEEYALILQANHGGGICTDSAGNVYYTFAAPYVIHKLDAELREVAAFDGASLPHYRPYPEQLLGEGWRRLQREERHRLMRSASTVLGLWYAEGVLFVKVSDPTGRNRSYVDVWSMGGQHLATYAVRDEHFAGISGGYCILVRTQETGTSEVAVEILLLSLQGKPWSGG